MKRILLALIIVSSYYSFSQKNTEPLDCTSGKGIFYEDLENSTTDIFIGKMIQQIDTIIDEVLTGVGEMIEKIPSNKSRKAYFIINEVIKTDNHLKKRDTVIVKLVDPKYTINVWDFTIDEKYVIFGVKNEGVIETCLCCLTMKKKEYHRKSKRGLIRYFRDKSKK